MLDAGSQVDQEFGPTSRRSPALDGSKSTPSPGMSARPARVEIRMGADMPAHAKAWRQLAQRALDPNPFAGPDVVLPALKHLPEGKHVLFALVWQADRLQGVIPIMPPRLPVLPQRLLVWRAAAAGPSVPLVDQEAAMAVLGAALGGLGERKPRAASLIFPEVPETGRFASLLRAVADRSGRSLAASEMPPWPFLTRNEAAPGARDGGESAEALARREEELTGLGTVTVDQACEPRDLRDAIEEFLVLEASGPLGARGAAAIQEPGRASFLRVTTRLLGRARRLRVDTLRIGGRPVAAAILLDNGRRTLLWKVAQDQSLAALSPGAQLMAQIARSGPEPGRLDAVDIPAASLGDTLVERLWPARSPAARYTLGIHPHPAGAAVETWAQAARRRPRQGGLTPPRATAGE